MQDRIDAFLRYMSAERGSPRNTIDAYRNDLARFAKFVAGRANGAGPAPAASDIDGQVIADYVAWLGRRAYAPTTIARKVATVRSFCGFLFDSGDLSADPAAGVDAPHAARTVPQPLTTQDVDALLREPLASNHPGAIRDAAMLELLYATGMRVTEMVSLNLESLRLRPRPGSVRCLGTGDRERTIPVYDRAADAVERYLGEARPRLVRDRPEDALFVNWRGVRLTRQGFWLILKKHARAAGIEARVTPHVLRHSFAAHMLRGGASVREVQALLGHANAATAQIYVQLAGEPVSG